MRYLTLYFFIIFNELSFGQILFEDKEHLLFDNETIYGEAVLGPGISFFDYNNDGWDDITIPASATQDFQFFKNVNGSFQKENLNISSDGVESRQAIWVDFDNDGDNDFFATSDKGGKVWLYRNDGNNLFVDITATSGLPNENLPYWGASWGDYDNDGFLDLFLSVRTFSDEQGNFLFRNNGDGSFIDMTVNAGIILRGDLTFCSSFFDYDNDGDLDIYTANDKCVTSNTLYKNNGDGTFTDASIEAGVNLYMSAMSTTIEDYDNDGWLDIYVTNFYPPFEDEDVTIGNAFLHNNGDGTFTNIALGNGTRFDSIGWGAVFLDVSNNTFKDLYVSGSIDGEDGRLSSALYVNDGDELFGVPQNVGLDDTNISFANAIGDIQNDGLADIVVINTRNAPISLWENNTTTTNNWIKINLEGTLSNRMGANSRIKVGVEDKIYYAYTLCGEGYISQNSNSEFFGLGNTTNIDFIEVIWQSGITDRIENIGINQTITIQEGLGLLTTDDYIELLDNEQLIVYPNPSSDQMTIKYNGNQQVSRATIINGFGMIIKEYNFVDFHQSKSIDVSNLNTGIYFIQIEVEGKIAIKKIIIH